MSVSSRTPNDKLHRYLQRIQKLVGNRARSPVSMIKSRSKSPMNIKTPRLDNYLKYEFTFRTLFSFFDRYNEKLLRSFINQLKLHNQKQLRFQKSVIKFQNKSLNWQLISEKSNKIQKEDKTLYVQLLVKPIKSILFKHLRIYFNDLKSFQIQTSARDIKKNNLPRRTYSEIYAKTINQSQIRPSSPSPIKNYQYTTPESVKKSNNINFHRKAQTQWLFNLLQKIQKNFYSITFSILKSISIKTIVLQFKQSQKQILKQKKQCLRLKQQILNLNEQLRQKSFLFEHDKSHMMSFQHKMRDQIENFSKFQYQIRKKKNVLAIQIKQLFKRKIFIYKFSFFSQIKYLKSKTLSITSINMLFLPKTLKSIIQNKIFRFFALLKYKSLDSQPLNLNSSLNNHQKINKSLSIYSINNSRGSAHSISSAFDIFAKKINKAFELKDSIRQIYSYSFQKIDYAALLYLSFSKPLNKIEKRMLKQSFNSILYFSVQKNVQLKQSKIQGNQQRQKNKISNKKVFQISNILQKIENHIKFQKIQAFSELKISYELKKRTKASDQSIILEANLKKQINQFLQQRNKMHKNCLENWQKTKLMLNDNFMRESKLSVTSKISN